MDKQEWKTRNIFNYKDYDYETQATINISISKAINLESKTTSPLNTLISINSSGLYRTVSLSYNKLYTLITGLKTFVNNWQDVMINCGKNSIKVKQVNIDPKLISFFILSSEQDFGNIVFNINIFMSICKLLSSIIDKYLELNMSMDNDIKNSSILYTMDSRIKNIEESMILLKSKVFNEMELKTPAITDNGNDTFDQMAEFDKFIGGNQLNKISIDELEKVDRDFKIEEELKYKEIVDNKNTKSINSSFISDVLKEDISNFENLITSVCRETNPTQKFIDILKISMIINDDNFKFLPDIKDNEYKSALYIGKLTFDTAIKKYLEQSVRIANNVSVIKYKVENKQNKNVELAYDLLLIMGYIKLMKEKLELKEDDAQTNRSITYLATRCFTDILYFSFLNETNPDLVKTCVLDRFKIYRKNNFFKSFEIILKNYGLNLIENDDISKFLDNVCYKVLSNNIYIDSMHKELYINGNVKIPPNNKLSIEQMINEAIKLEIDIKVNKLDPEKYISDKNSEIGRYLLSKYPILLKTYNEDSPILRVVKHYDDEIPNDIKSEFLNYIKNAGKEKRNIDYTKFKLTDFGNNIIKAIYKWNENETTKNDPFKELFVKIENFKISKDDILNKIEEKLNDPNDTIEVSNNRIEDILSDLETNKPKKEDSPEEDWLSEIRLE